MTLPEHYSCCFDDSACQCGNPDCEEATTSMLHFEGQTDNTCGTHRFQPLGESHIYCPSCGEIRSVQPAPVEKQWLPGSTTWPKTWDGTTYPYNPFDVLVTYTNN